MKIAFYMTTVLEHGGGLEKYLIETAAHLADYADISADIITMDNRHTDRLADALSVFYLKKMDKKLNYKEKMEDIQKRLRKANYYKMSSFKQLRKQLNHYDVVYSKNELIEGFIFKLLIGYKNVPPIIFGGHTPINYPNPESGHAKLHNVLYSGWLYRFLAGGVDKVHSINSYEETQYKKLLPAQRVYKIYNPFDVALFKKGVDKHAYPLGLDQSAINILWVGRLTEQKGVTDLIKLVEEVEKKLAKKAKVRWTIVGDGEQRSLAEKLASDFKNVRYLGHVEQKYIASIYKQHAIFVSTSKWEGYPYTLIEPQAFGLQVFAYDIPGASDILMEYQGGHIAKDLGKMIDILSAAAIDYQKPHNVPRSEPSDQFMPAKIYRQLIDMFGSNG